MLYMALQIGGHWKKGTLHNKMANEDELSRQTFEGT